MATFTPSTTAKTMCVIYNVQTCLVPVLPGAEGVLPRSLP